MSERDELIELIESNRRRIILAPEGESGVSVAFTSSEEQADAILAAGYRKPHVITTREELDALPDGSVIKDRFNSGFNMHPLHRGDTEFADAILPATVLWEPK